jgi:hypothetical protein
VSIKQADIVSAIETRLKTISTANGYHTALGTHVFVWLPAVIDVSELPAANIRDLDDTIERDTVPYDLHRMSVEIDVASTGVTAVRSAVYDVYKAIGTDPTFSGYAINTALLGHAFEVDQTEKIVVGAVISLAVLFRTSNYQES